jgi:DNA-binding NarL/FixJ family response regulator
MSAKTASAKPAARKRVFIVDDHPIVREGLVQQINRCPDLVVCGEANEAREAFAVINKLAPDLVVVDINLPGRSGLELIKDLRALHPRLPLLVLSMHEESVFAERALRAGARGYVSKQAGGDRFIEAVRRVLNGQVYMSEAVAALVIDTFTGRRVRGSGSPISLLTDRELEVFNLIGQAKEAKEIARRLGMSAKTVEAHRASIKRKLRLKTGPELTRRAVLWVETVAG